MEKSEILGIVRTITDGIRDAGMQYDYYCTAKQRENSQLAELHLAEMQKRLTGVQEWYKRAIAMLAEDIKPDTVAEALMEDYREKYSDLVKKCERARG